MILMCLLLTSTTLKASGKLPQGTWTVQQVTIEKTVDENTQITVYQTPNDLQSYYSCPAEWIINAQGLVIHYPNGYEEIAKYSFAGNQLTIFGKVAKQMYLCSVSEENLILTTTYNYLNNLLTEKVEQISEKWTIVFKK